MVRKDTFNEGTLTSKGNIAIAYSSFIPSKTTAQLLIVHGFSEHMRCYFEAAEELREKGVAVHIMDLPGHGLSGGPRGHIDDFQEFLDIVDLMLLGNPHFLKTKPTFIMGHSLGGLIATLYCLRKRPKIQGVILTSPLMGFPMVRSLPVWLLTRFLRVKKPAFQIPKPRNVAALCRNPDKWSQYASDPYRLQTITPNLYQSMVAETKNLRNKIHHFKLPLLVFYSAIDQVISPEAIQSFHAHAGSDDKTLIAFTEAMHELMQEEEKPLIIEKMLSWMNDRC